MAANIQRVCGHDPDKRTREAGVSTQISIAEFGDIMAELPAGVCAITLPDPDNRPLGLVVTSLTAYTADPASIIFCVAHTSRAHPSVQQATHLGAHLLAKGQDDVARAFASKADDKFAGLDWSWDDGVPRVAGAAAYGKVSLDKTFEHWDHTICIARIERVEKTEGAVPMVYLRRTFEWALTP
jgi:flavin reductase (DIM6/NTAB) family NADH-FMN oxidoreductase RutF